MLNVFAPVVTDHHFISNHKCLHEALAADGAPLSVGAVRLLAVVLGYRGRVGRGRCAGLARCTAFNEVCERQGDKVNHEITRNFKITMHYLFERESRFCVQ